MAGTDPKRQCWSFRKASPVLVFALFAACSSAASTSSESPQPTTVAERHEELEFDDAGGMAQASSLVLVGEVIGVDPLDYQSAEDPNASDWVTVTFASRRVLKGETASNIVMVWERTINDMVVVLDGISPPEVGDSYLLFVVAEDPETAATFGLGSAFRPVSLNGFIRLDGETLRGEYVGANQILGEINGMTVDQVEKLLSTG